ncbi:hypothetical protein [Brevundimonas sp.]|uniref:hypothetical protein n=1 Tax=Brevundimonas sp. TaxID=1871086 RepID=UPI00289EFABC|nr:hypothetical protein [Brevundimonas sp.]
MTKLRWVNPPKENDPSGYKAECDPTIRFIGKKDRDLPSDRQLVLNRLIEVEDQLNRCKRESPTRSSPNSGFLTGSELAESLRLNEFDDNLSVENAAGSETVAANVILQLTAEKTELQERLRKLPRTDEF